MEQNSNLLIHALTLLHLTTHLTSRSLRKFYKQTAAPNLEQITGALSSIFQSHTANLINRALVFAKYIVGKAQEHKMHMTHLWATDYPEALRRLSRPPYVLFYWGNLPKPNVRTLCVVGSRKPNRYGIELIDHILPNLQMRPLQIVSGLAYGIDFLAHDRSCRIGIPNFAILGSSLDCLYPQDHFQLAQHILETGGAILSEFPPNTQAHPSHFPRRNRIIAALADVIWVVQASIYSGTRHTIDFAHHLGKEIVASPGDLFSELSDIPNHLLYDGAQMILNASDLDYMLQKSRYN